MATIATDVKWGTEPTLLFNFSYEKRRSGANQEYQITVECEPLPVAGVHYFGYPIHLEITAAGKAGAVGTLKQIEPYRWDKAITFTTKWMTITNKTTGTTALKIRVYSSNGSARDITYSYNLAIDPATSQVAATDANIESVSTVTITRYNSAFTHKLAYKAAGQSSYTALQNPTDVTSYAWTVPKAIYGLIPDAKTIDITLRCQTYNGDALVGTTTCEMTATAAESKCAPSISVTAVDSNENTIALTGSNKRIIRYHSDVKVTATVSAKNSASITKTTLGCGAKEAAGTTYTFTDAESATVTAKAADSRGYSKSAKATGLTLVNYVKLTANTTAERTHPTADTVKVVTRGNYFNGSFGAVNNTIQAEVRFKPQTQAEYTDDDIYTDMTITLDGNAYTATATISGLDYLQTYDIRVRVRDQVYAYQGPLADARYNNIKLSKGIPVFDWGEDDFRFNVPIYSGGVNFTQLFATADGTTGLAQGESATFDEISNHRLYYVRPTTSNGTSSANVYIPCTRIGNMITGVGGYPHSSGRIDIFCVYLTITNNNTITVTYCGYWNTKEQAYAARKIHGIYGVL
jgi:hypothetical protein